MPGGGARGQNLEHFKHLYSFICKFFMSSYLDNQTTLILGPKVTRRTSRHLTPGSIPWDGVKGQTLVHL